MSTGVRLKSNLAKLFRRRGVVTLLIAFLVYLALTAYVHELAYSDQTWEKADTRNLAVALWASAIFAGVVGMLAAISALFKPDEDSLDQRLSYLFPNSNNLTPTARARLLEGVIKLAAPAVAGDFHIHVQRYDPQEDAFWLEVHIAYTLLNILRDEPYLDERCEAYVAPDRVSAKHAETGRISEISVTCGSRKTVHVQSIGILAATGSFQQIFTLEIPPGSEAVQTYIFSAWCKRRVPWKLSTERYTEKVTFRVTNQSGENISCALQKLMDNVAAPVVELGKKPVLPLDTQVIGTISFCTHPGTGFNLCSTNEGSVVAVNY